MWSSSIRKLPDESLLLCLQNHRPINGRSLTGYLLTLSPVSILYNELVICAVKLIILTGNSWPPKFDMSMQCRLPALERRQRL